MAGSVALLSGSSDSFTIVISDWISGPATRHAVSGAAGGAGVGRRGAGGARYSRVRVRMVNRSLDRL